MRSVAFFVLLALPIVICSCATPHPPQTFHGPKESVLVVKSLDNHFSELVSPVAMAREDNVRMLDQIKSLSRQKMAIIILENYSESQPGPDFRDRSLEWFMGLRGLGFDRIVFLQGKGVAEPDGLVVLADYD
jgi:hypothetical protein